MSEKLRSIFARLRVYIGNRRRPKRRGVRLKAIIAIHLGRGLGTRSAGTLEGYTQDVSASGLSLVLPAIRIGTDYLTGDDRRLRVTLYVPTEPKTTKNNGDGKPDAPATSINLIAAPVRYHLLEDEPAHTSKRYVVGARILEMSAEHRAQLNAYLRRHG